MKIVKNSKGVQFNDRLLAGEVRGMGLEYLKQILAPKYKDKDFQKQILLKLAPSLLPRLNEVTGEGGGPLQVVVPPSVAESFGIDGNNTVNGKAKRGNKKQSAV